MPNPPMRQSFSSPPSGGASGSRAPSEALLLRPRVVYQQLLDVRCAHFARTLISHGMRGLSRAVPRFRSRVHSQTTTTTTIIAGVCWNRGALRGGGLHCPPGLDGGVPFALQLLQHQHGLAEPLLCGLILLEQLPVLHTQLHAHALELLGPMLGHRQLRLHLLDALRRLLLLLSFLPRRSGGPNRGARGLLRPAAFCIGGDDSDIA
mmetsp:Transcript_128328/g.411263  ORF Transcript_128328/g.411263 Transcript_128328/m.411263 type:complete len:206 (-) Transcript_128328:157-774(-)